MWRRVPCEQQLNMGQSVLRDAVKTVSEGPGERKSEAWHFPKGNRVNIPEPGKGDSFFGSRCGNANQHGDVSKSPGESCLFFVRSQVPGIGLTGDRDFGSVKHRGSCGVQCTFGNP